MTDHRIAFRAAAFGVSALVYLILATPIVVLAARVVA